MYVEKDYKRNYGIMIPQSFTTSWECCIVHVHFEFNKKWEEFKEWVKEGNLRQCSLDGNVIDVWVRRNTDLYGNTPASLQEHFNTYCKPSDGYGFSSFTIEKVAELKSKSDPNDLKDTPTVGGGYGFKDILAC